MLSPPSSGLSQSYAFDLVTICSANTLNRVRYVKDVIDSFNLLLHVKLKFVFVPWMIKWKCVMVVNSIKHVLIVSGVILLILPSFRSLADNTQLKVISKPEAITIAKDIDRLRKAYLSYIQEGTLEFRVSENHVSGPAYPKKEAFVIERKVRIESSFERDSSRFDEYDLVRDELARKSLIKDGIVHSYQSPDKIQSMAGYPRALSISREVDNRFLFEPNIAKSRMQDLYDPFKFTKYTIEQLVNLDDNRQDITITKTDKTFSVVVSTLDSSGEKRLPFTSTKYVFDRLRAGGLIEYELTYRTKTEEIGLMELTGQWNWSWKHSGGVFIPELQQGSYSQKRNGKLYDKKEYAIYITRFVKQEVDPEKFTVEALKVALGTLVSDNILGIQYSYGDSGDFVVGVERDIELAELTTDVPPVTSKNRNQGDVPDDVSESGTGRQLGHPFGRPESTIYWPMWYGVGLAIFAALLLATVFISRYGKR